MIIFLVVLFGTIWTICFIQIAMELQYIRKKMK